MLNDQGGYIFVFIWKSVFYWNGCEAIVVLRLW